MKRTFTSLLCLSLFSFSVFAQQEAQFSQNMFNRLTTNPAYAGSSGSICGTALYRSQWVGFPGAPKTALISVDAPITNRNSGVGLTIMSDRLGFDKSILARASYSFHIPLSSGSLLAIGAEAGMLQKTLSSNSWIAPQTLNDIAIPAPASSGMALDLGLGVYYKSNDLYFGLSATQLPQSILKDQSFEFKTARHYYITGGWTWTCTPNLSLTPSVFVKSDAVTTQADINLIAKINDRFWGGASYRLTDAVVAMAGLQQGPFKFGYAYDITTSALKNHSSNSHEIMIGYCFTPVTKCRCTIYDNVRLPGGSGKCGCRGKKKGG